MSKTRKATMKLFGLVGEKKGREILRKLTAQIESGELEDTLERLIKELKKGGK